LCKCAPVRVNERNRYGSNYPKTPPTKLTSVGFCRFAGLNKIALLAKFTSKFDAEEIVILSITGDKITVLNPRQAIF